MIVSLAVFNQRLAAVFDSAEQFALYQVQEQEARFLGLLPIRSRSATDMATQLAQHCVSRVICGAICGCDRRLLTAAGMEVAPWICGTMDEVIEALCTDRLETLAMPGCAGACMQTMDAEEASRPRGQQGAGRKRRLGNRAPCSTPGPSGEE